MTANHPAPAQPADASVEADMSKLGPTSSTDDSPNSSDAFQAALEAEVARRIDAVERRWQSRKDRELNRARRRWESEASHAIDPELLSWIAAADSREVGQWLKAGLTGSDATPSETASDQNPQPTESSASEEPAAPQAAEAAEQADQANSNPPAGTESVDQPDDSQSASESHEDQPPVADLELEARARDQLAERRSQDPSPDLFPSRGAPADAFHQIEAGFARGEVDLDTYETARRRHGLT